MFLLKHLNQGSNLSYSIIWCSWFSCKYLQDAWLDSVDVYEKYTGKASIPESNDDNPRDLSTDELAKINRQIADVLEPGETVIFFHHSVFLLITYHAIDK